MPRRYKSMGVITANCIYVSIVQFRNNMFYFCSFKHNFLQTSKKINSSNKKRMEIQTHRNMVTSIRNTSNGSTWPWASKVGRCLSISL